MKYKFKLSHVGGMWDFDSSKEEEYIKLVAIIETSISKFYVYYNISLPREYYLTFDQVMEIINSGTLKSSKEKIVRDTITDIVAYDVHIELEEETALYFKMKYDHLTNFSKGLFYE